MDVCGVAALALALHLLHECAISIRCHNNVSGVTHLCATKDHGLWSLMRCQHWQGIARRM
jgi:hypothetical protein